MAPAGPPAEGSPLPTRRARLGGVYVTISEPENPSGITFLLPGSMLSEASYLSTRRVLHEDCNQIVISFYINVFSKSHDAYAQDVERIFADYMATCQATTRKKPLSSSTLFQGFNIVGHSVGAKIALLCATTPLTMKKTPTTRATSKTQKQKQQQQQSHPNKQPHHQVYSVLALDPVDESPCEFTADDPRRNRSLSKHFAQTLILTHATATPTWAIPPAHNAQAIRDITEQNNNSSNRNFDKILQFIVHKDAAHMAYTDNGGIMGWIMGGGGTKQGNLAARQDAHALIRRSF